MKAIQLISKFIFFLLAILPLGIGCLFALAYALGMNSFDHDKISLVHLSTVLGDASFYISMMTSIIIACVTVLISYWIALLMLPTLIAKYPSDLPAIFYWPMLLPPIISAFIGYFYLNDAGLLIRIFQQPIGTWTLVQDNLQIGVMLVLIWLTTPYFILLMYRTYKQHNLDKYIHQAHQLGSSIQFTKANIIWPLLWQKLKRNVLLNTVLLSTVYELPLMIGNLNHPMISVLISRKFQKFNLADLPQAYAMTALLSASIMLAVYFIIDYNKDNYENQ